MLGGPTLGGTLVNLEGRGLAAYGAARDRSFRVLGMGPSGAGGFIA
jgi:hypothetical protein